VAVSRLRNEVRGPGRDVRRIGRRRRRGREQGIGRRRWRQRPRIRRPGTRGPRQERRGDQDQVRT
jgi:hypothetical protein